LHLLKSLVSIILQLIGYDCNESKEVCYEHPENTKVRTGVVSLVVRVVYNKESLYSLFIAK